MPRFLIRRLRETPAGTALDPVSLLGQGESSILVGTSAEAVLANARVLTYGQLVALELDARDRPIAMVGAA